MASRLVLYYVLFYIISKQIDAFNIPRMDGKEFNYKIPSGIENFIDACANRDAICKCNDTRVCATRFENTTQVYEDFENQCYLFLSNKCDNPGAEYFIIASGSCKEYLSARRAEDSVVDTNTDAAADEDNDQATEAGDIETDGYTEADTKNILRQKTSVTKISTKLSTIYEIDYAYDDHLCPISCTDIYHPVCLNVNRGQGKYFKVLTFLNHCQADMYYCKNTKEFKPAPGFEESVSASDLSWSRCGSSRYMQFTRFAESTSSLGHYGWLAGPHGATHMLEPHERKPGYGK